MQQTDFLDITQNLCTNYWPYKKPNSNLQYVHHQSNHPPTIIKQLPTMIEKRLSNIFCDQNELKKAEPTYQQALAKSGYSHPLKFQSANQQTQAKKKQKKEHNLVQSPIQ